MSASLARFHQLVSAVVAFSLQVTAVQAVFKLGQDTPDELWQRVQDGLAADPAPVQMARDMVHLEVPALVKDKFRAAQENSW
jgi:hypothetical protein